MTKTEIPPAIAALAVTIGEDRGEITFEPFDSEFFEIAIGRVHLSDEVAAGPAKPLLHAMSEAALDAGYDQLLRRVPASSFGHVWVLESTGYRLMDVGVTFARRVDTDHDANTSSEVVVDTATVADIDRLLETMFDVPWGSRYESDPAYDRRAVQRLHSQWLRNSLDGRADHVLIGHVDGRAAGYVTCRLVEEHGERIGEIDLVGTVPMARGRGVASAVVGGALDWFAQHVGLVTVRTQVTNHTAVGVYERAGMTLRQSDMTFRLALTQRGGRP